MAIEYNVRFEDDGTIVTRTGESPTAPKTTQDVAAGVLLASNPLGPSFGVEAGNGSNASVGSGGGPRIGSGGGPRIGSGDRSTAGMCGLDLNGVIALVLGAGGCAGRPGPSMPFEVETQEESNWCWAAVASAVDRYYNPNLFLSQCEVVEEMPNAAGACLDADKHNNPGALENALNAIGRGNPLIKGEINFTDLTVEIDAGRPVCVAIDWLDGGTHFVVLCGYQQWTNGRKILETVDVADPFYPDSTRTLSDFPGSYHGGGSWVQTYITK